MKVAIRADASLKIGTGHVMRCLALAQELRRKGTRVFFICREHPGNICEMIVSNGFEVIKLGPDQYDGKKREVKEAGYKNNADHPSHADWLDVDQYTDARQSIDVIQKDAPLDWLIVDHYALDHRWESSLRQVAKNIMVIDDLADRRHDCDLLLDQNYFQEPYKRYEGLLLEKCQTLLGPRYALLRPEFRQARKFSRMRGNGVGRVLVYFGGNDPANLTGMTLEALDTPEMQPLLVELVVGTNNQHLVQLMKQAQKRPGTRLHIQPKNFIELLLRSDLCIGAGGTITWERLCLGLPSVVITVAKNQEAFTAELDKAGYVTWLGSKEDISVLDIREGLLRKISEWKKEKKNSVSPGPVDGFGAMRLAERLMSSPEKTLILRKAAVDDMEMFYFWANDPVTRDNSFQQKPISWNEHVYWFTDKLGSGHTYMWILQTMDGLPVGQIRFDIHNDTADIDYCLDPIARGRGWSKKLLALGLTEFKEDHGNIVPMDRVKMENITSRRAFQHLGFSEKIERADKCFLLAVISDRNSWINWCVPALLADWLHQGHAVLWAHHPHELTSGDFCFLLGCGQIMPSEILPMFKHNLVIHESDLPSGKGWSPLTWQILEEKNEIPVTLLEAVGKVDSGDIYIQEKIKFAGHELVEDLRRKQAEATIRLCKRFVDDYPEIVRNAQPQKGDESFYPHRSSQHSQLDPDKTIREQFCLFRVVDNKRYPAWFDLNGYRYVLKIEKNDY